MTLSPAELVHGPVLIGTFLSVALWGVCLIQLYLYQKSSWRHVVFSRDSAWVRTFIYLLFLAETLQTAFVIVFTYDGLIINFGNFSSLVNANWLGATDPALTGIIGGSVQIFFVRRLRILTKNWIAVTIVSICAVATILMGIATAAAIHFVPEYTEFRRFKVVVIIWLVSAVIADMVITFSLVISLNKWRKSLIDSSGANTYIDHLVQMTIQTGLLTSACAIIDLILFLAHPTGLHLIFNLALSKLYSNSLMSSLNARDLWNFESSTEANMPNISRIEFTTGNTIQTDTRSTPGRQNTEIFVQVERTRSRNSIDLSQMSMPESSYEKEVKTKRNTFNNV